MLNEFSEAMPRFGGPSSRLPAPYDQILQDYQRLVRNRRPRNKVQRPPKKYR
ncbi:unnamed protein product [Protopolystoma xenopodis]|uniref:Uncharacterized protein n=1 Tax=Protopolystoma xenopodis TaxID=117903 RepID=A0A448WY84_9PLAT|nr:unnamed protein product [Protopolystoma xenopodis]